MAPKRKLDSSTSNDSEPQKRLHQVKQEEVVEEEEYEEVEVEVEEEVEEEEEEEEEEEVEVEEEEEDPVQNILEPFTKEQLRDLLLGAAEKHRDVADRIRNIADASPNHRKIFVHGLGWDTTTENLRAAFAEFGEIEDCKAVQDKVSGKSKGYGFVVFKARAGARKALAEPHKKIGDRMTACQLAVTGPVPASAPAQAPAAPASEYTQRKIYVSNVGADIDPGKLFTFFSQFGEIEEGPMGLDKVTGKPKGFCLFVYKTVDSAMKALEEQHKKFEGHILNCQRAIDGPKPGKLQQHGKNKFSHRQNNQRPDNPIFPGGSGPAHPVASGATGMSYNQVQTALNPALGQALTALLASNLLSGLAGAAAPTVQGGYGNHQAGVSPGLGGAGYGSPGTNHGGYSGGQQMGRGRGGRGRGRGRGGRGQYGGAQTY